MPNYVHRQRQVLCQRIRCLGIDRRIVYAIVDLTAHWVECSGPEWTVQRIKSLKVDYIRHMDNKGPVGTWYAKKRDGTPKGPFGALWTSVRPPQALAVLNLYSILISRDPTPKQWKKFSDAVRLPENKEEKAVKTEEAISEWMFQIICAKRPKTEYPKVKSMDSFVASSNKMAPTGLNTRSVPEDDWWISLRAFQSDYYQQTLLPLPCIRQALGPNWLSRLPISEEDYDYRWGAGAYIGNIGSIQEPGMKLRAVANPHRVVQRALEPLGDTLFECLRNVLTDCTFNQQSGCEFVQKALRLGRRAWSIDLSDATSSFPFAIQENALRKCTFIPQDQVELFVRASRGLWRVGNKTIKEMEPGIKFIRWTRGQPLGLYPSFASFTLGHHAVLQYCWKVRKELILERKNKASDKELAQLQEYPLADCYRICGDDIVILDYLLAQLYFRVMQILGVQISMNKTLEDALVAEFAGRIITPNAIISLPKWRSSSDNSFVDVLRQFGPQAIGLLRPRQKRVMKWLAPLPEELGGLGWNPKGIPLQDRLFQAQKFIYRDASRLVPTEEPASRVRRWVNAASYGLYQNVSRKANAWFLFRKGLDAKAKALSSPSREKYLKELDQIKAAFGDQGEMYSKSPGPKKLGVFLLPHEGEANPFIRLNPETSGFMTLPDQAVPIKLLGAPVAVSQKSVPQTNSLRMREITGVNQEVDHMTNRLFGLPSKEDTSSSLIFQKPPDVQSGWIPKGSSKGRKTTLEVLEQLSPIDQDGSAIGDRSQVEAEAPKL